MYAFLYFIISVLISSHIIAVYSPLYVDVIIGKYAVNMWIGFFWLRMSPLAMLMDLWVP
jgi:hypothetical protein